MSTRSSLVDIAAPDGTADGYLSRPDGDTGSLAVLLLTDAFGLRPQIEHMADRIAAQGYVVLAPNVYYRNGRAPVAHGIDLTDPESRAAVMQSLKPLRDQLTPDRITRDGGAYLDCLAELTPGPAAVAGYCMGGRFGWQIMAAHPDRVAALGAFHPGRMVTDKPDSPHLSAVKLRGELYFGYADHDPNMTAEQIVELERALDEAAVRYSSEVYAGAEHGYTMADTAAFNESASERHFGQLFDLLRGAMQPQRIT